MFEGGRISFNFARIYGALLPLAASSFIGDENRALFDVLKICNHYSQVELVAFSNSTECEHLSNSGRAYRFLLRYPCNQ